MSSRSPGIDALARVIRTADAEQALPAGVAKFFEPLQLSAEHAAHLEEVGASRLLMYRALAHNGMRGATRDFLPRSAARLGPRFRQDFDAFIAEVAPRTRFLREVPVEFVAWASPRWIEAPDVPAFLPDLARHELLDQQLRFAPGERVEPTGAPPAIDRPLVFHPSTTRVRYAHAVHRLPLSTEDRSVPDAGDYDLCVYRDAKHAVRYLELTRFAAAVIDALSGGQAPLGEGLQRAARSIGAELDDEHLGAAAVLLHDLGERGVCLGAKVG